MAKHNTKYVASHSLYIQVGQECAQENRDVAIKDKVSRKVEPGQNSLGPEYDLCNI
jgi:hypothetical protein